MQNTKYRRLQLIMEWKVEAERGNERRRIFWLCSTGSGRDNAGDNLVRTAANRTEIQDAVAVCMRRERETWLRVCRDYKF